jgi:uncharacterized SAM-binding protein YcdF (DUF218 family)
MFELKKAITYLLMPLQLSLVLMLAGLAMVWFSRRGRLGKILATTGVLLLLILSHKQVGIALLQPLETHYPAIPELVPGTPMPDALADCRVIVVLGGGHASTPGLSATNRLSTSAASRLIEGVRLAQLLPTTQLILTGPGITKNDLTHGAVLAQAAQSLGVSPARTELLTSARDTEEEINALRERFGDTPIALVTSAWHMPRTMAYARKAGLNALPCPADFTARANEQFHWNDWTCDLTGLERSTKGIYERLGMLWARLRGRI